VIDIDQRGVANDLAAMASAVYDGTLAAIPGAHDWLTGRHEGWGDPSLWGTLPDRLRDRMERAAGDLAMGWPQSGMEASTALRNAAALIEEELGSGR
jgi:hypothetical protein